MGLYDYIECEACLPDGWKPKHELQTKCLGCGMLHYRLTKEGRLLRTYSDWEGDINFHGVFIFYSHEGRCEDNTWKWHEYRATFHQGQLQRIEEMV